MYKSFVDFLKSMEGKTIEKICAQDADEITESVANFDIFFTDGTHVYFTPSEIHGNSVLYIEPK